MGSGRVKSFLWGPTDHQVLKTLLSTKDFDAQGGSLHGRQLDSSLSQTAFKAMLLASSRIPLSSPENTEKVMKPEPLALLDTEPEAL